MQKIIKAIIIDDQQSAIDSLKQDLRYLFPDEIQIIGESTTIDQAVILFKEMKPNLVFLDIDLKKGTGFDFLNLISNLEHSQYEIIFITAFNQFAIKAIKFSAFDYLLKPIDPDELEHAIKRLQNNFIVKSKYTKSNVDLLVENSKSIEIFNKKIAIPTQDQIHFISLNDIVYCESEHNYTKFYLQNNTKIMVSKTIKEYELLLSSYNFIRPHQRFLVNKKYIQSFLKEDGGMLLLSRGEKLPVSRRKKDEVLKFINTF